MLDKTGGDNNNIPVSALEGYIFALSGLLGLKYRQEVRNSDIGYRIDWFTSPLPGDSAFPAVVDMGFSPVYRRPVPLRCCAATDFGKTVRR